MAAPLHVRLQPILRKVDGDEAVNTWIEELSLRKAYSLDTTQKVLLNQAFRILELKSKSEFTSNSIDSIDEAIWNYLGALPMRFWITEALEGVTAEMYALKQVSYKLRSWMAVEVPVDFTGRLHPLTEWIVDPKPNAYGHYAPDSVFEPILSQIKAIIDPMSTPAGLKDGLFALKVIQTRLGTFYIERGYSHWKRVGNPILLPSAYNGAGAIVYAEDLTSKHSEMLRQIAPGCMTDTPGPFAECCDAWQELSSQIHETLQITGDGHALQTLLEVFSRSTISVGHD